MTVCGSYPGRHRQNRSWNSVLTLAAVTEKARGTIESLMLGWASETPISELARTNVAFWRVNFWLNHGSVLFKISVRAEFHFKYPVLASLNGILLNSSHIDFLALCKRERRRMAWYDTTYTVVIWVTWFVRSFISCCEETDFCWRSLISCCEESAFCWRSLISCC
jgi:hypothetical protein